MEGYMCMHTDAHTSTLPTKAPSSNVLSWFKGWTQDMLLGLLAVIVKIHLTDPDLGFSLTPLKTPTIVTCWKHGTYFLKYVAKIPFC